MKSKDLNKLIENLTDLTKKLDELDVYELYSDVYDTDDKLDHFINLLPDLNKKDIDVLVEYIEDHHNILFFPNESILDQLKAEKVLENWDKLEI